jgi:serine/threonine protein kinase/tetratricopeptide (TPR) repeat protein
MQPAAPEVSICAGCGRPVEETSLSAGSCTLCLLRVGIDGEAGLPQDLTPNGFEGDAHFGAYEIERREDGSLYELGRGAMGVTYRAIDTTLHRKVALKIITIGIAGQSTEARERFIREARTAAALRHENIATVFQFGIREQTGQFFYAMELIEGETLEERVRRTGPLDVCATIEIAQQVTSALGAAEKYGLIHRDLKPANLMLMDRDEVSTPRGGNWASQRAVAIVKIIDFGLAKALNARVDPMRLTHSGFVGTPAFASPEQFENTALNMRSDIYSLGVTLWFAVTGKTPFAGHTVEEIHRAQQSNFLPVEQLKAARVPSRLRSLIKSMLAFEPAARPGTHELAVRLQRCSAQASVASSTRLALAAVAILILGTFGFFAFHSLRTHPATAGSALDATVPDKSIAVLPFENLSDEKDAFFADALHDDLLTKLAKIADLKVISRTSVMQYRGRKDVREIGRALGVSHVLEGTVRRSGQKVHVNAQLVDARAGTALWSEEYDRDLNEILAVEVELAQSIANDLGAFISAREKLAIQERATKNLIAFDLYTRAKNLLLTASSSDDARAHLMQATDLLNQAVAHDPSFFQAYCQLAQAHDRIYVRGYDHTPARVALAEAAVRTASRLRPDAGETHLARAENLYEGDLDYDGALAELELARQSLPNDARVYQLMGQIQSRQGRLDESERNLERAVELDPRDFETLQQIAISYDLFRRYPEANLVLDPPLGVDPNYVETRAVGAFVDLDWKANSRPLHQMIDEVRARKYSPNRSPSFSSSRSEKKARVRSAWRSRPHSVVLSMQSVVKFVSGRAGPRFFGSEGRRAKGSTTSVSTRRSRSQSRYEQHSHSWWGDRQLRRDRRP